MSNEQAREDTIIDLTKEDADLLASVETFYLKDPFTFGVLVDPVLPTVDCFQTHPLHCVSKDVWFDHVQRTLNKRLQFNGHLSRPILRCYHCKRWIALNDCQSFVQATYLTPLLQTLGDLSNSTKVRLENRSRFVLDNGSLPCDLTKVTVSNTTDLEPLIKQILEKEEKQTPTLTKPSVSLGNAQDALAQQNTTLPNPSVSLGNVQWNDLLTVQASLLTNSVSDNRKRSSPLVVQVKRVKVKTVREVFVMTRDKLFSLYFQLSSETVPNTDAVCKASGVFAAFCKRFNKEYDTVFQVTDYRKTPKKTRRSHPISNHFVILNSCLQRLIKSLEKTRIVYDENNTIEQMRAFFKETMYRKFANVI